MRSVILGFFLALFSNQVKADGSAHEYTFNSIDGEPMPFSSYKGKALLVVNTASKCGFTGQYDGLQSLWENYRDKGLVVVGVPSNDFAGQEPGSKEQIKEFCSVNFNVNFPMTSKVVVKGDDAHPFYQWAKDVAGGPMWNFHKYLISPDGNMVRGYSSLVGPESKKLTKAIEKVLPN